MVEPPFFIPSLCPCLAVTIVIIMIQLLHAGREKGHVCYPGLLIMNCAEVTGKVLVKLTEWLTHWQRLTGLLSDRLSD